MQLENSVKENIYGWCKQYGFSMVAADAELAFLKNFIPDKHITMIRFSFDDLYHESGDETGAIITLHKNAFGNWS